MKMIIVSFLLSLTLNNASAAKAEKLSEQKVIKLLDSYFAAWKTRDIRNISKLYHKEIKLYDLPSDSITEGIKKVVKTMDQNWLTPVPDMIWAKTGVALVSGNTVTYEWVYAGKFTGSWGKVMLDKKYFSIKGISKTTFADNGKIKFQKDFYDLKSFERELGL